MNINTYAWENLMSHNTMKNEKVMKPEKIKVENETSFFTKLLPLSFIR
ncbi:hypothetical protein P5G65_21415 [Paenibacillus chondroitinus]|uniref:Uncharacterized protein n=1 Tax=Paenibacillus chondroitinus TaxID=59842 RepID=A0ABU6DFE2_9BACL|nr:MULTISPECIES: hypothetical protein [Paenibacillus]MCY9659196.1 hypothetical protein [Paenibacillus anseongense]MEB4796469.1 hypothetical protein [Paenibacillus chondroitinus]